MILRDVYVCKVRRVEQGNRVRIPDGTAAVCAEVVLVDESQSLENWEGRAWAAGEFSLSASQKTYKKIICLVKIWGGLLGSQVYGCDNLLDCYGRFFICQS